MLHHFSGFLENSVDDETRQERRDAALPNGWKCESGSLTSTISRVMTPGWVVPGGGGGGRRRGGHSSGGAAPGWGRVA